MVIQGPANTETMASDTFLVDLVETSDSGSSDDNNSEHSDSSIKNKKSICRRRQTGDHHERDETPTNCPTCGIQLFRLKRNWFTRRTRLIPSNVKGFVENGVCVTCSNDSIESSAGLASDANRFDGYDGEAETPTPADFVGVTIYSGDYNIYGQRHGHGEAIWNNGDRYVGNFFNGIRDGKGTLWFSDGSEYNGSWSCNRMHGIGTRRFANGDVYCGSYKDGKRWGMGKFYFINGDLYNGNWENDVMHGPGKYFFASGKCFEGNFRLGCRHGLGKTQYISGKLDLFCYDFDVKVGNGVRWSKDRKKVWMLTDIGKKQKRISIQEAISMQYQMDGDPELLYDQWQEWPVLDDHQQLSCGL